jgi:hypothetical protein
MEPAPSPTANKNALSTAIERFCATSRSAVDTLPSSGVESHVWKEASETLILIDWDDTLCPTAHLGHMGYTIPNDSERQAVHAHEVVVVEFLRKAVVLGHVAIVTMAETSWVEHSLELMPTIAKVVEELGIEIIRARESCARWLRRSAYSDDCRDPSHFFKTQAMKQVIKKFYKTGPRSRSWKNIVSIGDSCAERFALQDLVFHHKQRNGCKDTPACRCKTLLMLSSPSLDQMSEELLVIQNVLPKMVVHDGDFDLDLEERDLMKPSTR